MIFDIQCIRANGLGGRISSHVAPNATAPFLGASTNGSFEAESIWFHSFRADDKRRDGTFVFSWNKNGTTVTWNEALTASQPYASETPFPRKFLDPLMTGTSAEEPNYIVLRYAEVLLMIAEAANEVAGAPTAEAYTAVNAIRTRAGIPAMTPGLSHDLFRDSVFNERRWELSLEGPNGYFDSQRNWAWAKARVEQSMKHARSNSSKFPKANNTPIADTYKLLPIPQRAIDLNPELTQNPDLEIARRSKSRQTPKSKRVRGGTTLRTRFFVSWPFVHAPGAEVRRISRREAPRSSGPRRERRRRANGTPPDLNPGRRASRAPHR